MFWLGSDLSIKISSFISDRRKIFNLIDPVFGLSFHLSSMFGCVTVILTPKLAP